MKRVGAPLYPPATHLVEEAVHLLRGAAPATLAIYFAGTVPFVLGLLFFWAHVTWFQPSEERIAFAALGLAGLFIAMKLAQAEFCARLLAARLGAPPPAWSWPRLRRVAIGQARLQAWTLCLLVLAAVVSVPFGWTYAYAQNLSVLANSERPHAQALAQAKLWPGQNHCGLLLISALALAAWVNLATAFAAVPWLANKLLGLENVFGFSGWWFLNTTFLAAVTALTWLAIDPLVKAFYVLRVFHGRARRSGEDVRVDLQRAGHFRRSAVVAAALLGLFAWPGNVLRSADTAAVPSAIPPAQLDRAIDEVLAGPDFSWRLRPPPAAKSAPKASTLSRMFRTALDMVGDVMRSVGRGLRQFVDWVERHLGGSDSRRERAAHGGADAALSVLRLLLYAFIIVVVGLIIWVIYLMVRGARRPERAVLTATAVKAATPDLQDENVQAAQLPADGWLALAREQAARGDWRLALRALYLATLAQLATEGFVSLAKFKTNLDYEREVRRRALSRVEVAARFAARRREFEAAWYGRAQADETQVQAWLAELERPLAP